VLLILWISKLFQPSKVLIKICVLSCTHISLKRNMCLIQTTCPHPSCWSKCHAMLYTLRIALSACWQYRFKYRYTFYHISLTYVKPHVTVFSIKKKLTGNTSWIPLFTRIYIALFGQFSRQKLGVRKLYNEALEGVVLGILFKNLKWNVSAL
jgi:hypothetical protein